MSFASKLLQSSVRLWNGISVTRSFHALVRPTIGTSSPAQNSLVHQQQLNGSNNQVVPLLSPLNTLVQQVAGFKVKGRLKRRCKDCLIVVRQERGYVICPTHPRHKQMSMKKRDYKSWLLTHATQSKERGF
ncbi:uncharacterized protein LOC133846095 [Drosophila sulfurigaster albostrigata]|uniref:uncharacterized protein LOC133846095 n=1 Tax=Drosophila sulfurigaster albostrigata TaxID=89887 RepID=UPI002D21E1B2|nr:uncharacterized protein LOC133846095 [Drosophila sulfurigaster albostrigata]